MLEWEIRPGTRFYVLKALSDSWLQHFVYRAHYSVITEIRPKLCSVQIQGVQVQWSSEQFLVAMFFLCKKYKEDSWNPKPSHSSNETEHIKSLSFRVCSFYILQIHSRNFITLSNFFVRWLWQTEKKKWIKDIRKMSFTPFYHCWICYSALNNKKRGKDFKKYYIPYIVYNKNIKHKLYKLTILWSVWGNNANCWQ